MPESRSSESLLRSAEARRFRRPIAAKGDRTRRRFDRRPGFAGSTTPRRKYILFKRGLLTSPLARPPAPAITEADKAEVDFLMERTAAKCRNAGLLKDVFN